MIRNILFQEEEKEKEYARILSISDTTQNFLILFLHIFDLLLKTSII